MGKPNLEKMKAKKDIEGLIKTLKYKDRSIRWKTIEILGELGENLAIEPLIQALKDEYDLVRFKAAETLGKIGDVRAVEPLTQYLKERDPIELEDAAKALGRIGGTQATEALAERLEDTPIVQYMMDKYGDREKAERFAQAVEGKDQSLSPFISEDTKYMLRMEADKIRFFRLTVADELVKLGDDRGFEYLIQALLKDENKLYRKAAAGKLGSIGDTRAVTPLIQALDKDKDRNVRETAREALKKIKKS